jgi:hypothetical protein
MSERFYAEIAAHAMPFKWEILGELRRARFESTSTCG